MERVTLMHALAFAMALACTAEIGLTAETDKEKKEACPNCPPSGRMAEQQMKEHERMGQPSGRKAPHREMSMSPLDFKDTLNLTSEQIEKLKPIETDYRKALIKKEADVRVAEVELAGMLDDRKLDVGAIKKKIRDIGDMKTDMMTYRVDVLLKLREILGEEQYRKYRALLKERMEQLGDSMRMHEMGGMMH